MMRALVLTFLALTVVAAEVSAQEAPPAPSDDWVADAIDDILSDDTMDQLIGEAEQALAEQGANLTTIRDAERRARQRGEAAGRYAARAAQSARSSAVKAQGAQDTTESWAERNIGSILIGLITGVPALGVGLRALSNGRKMLTKAVNPMAEWAQQLPQYLKDIPPPPPIATGNGAKAKPSGRHPAVSP